MYEMNFIGFAKCGLRHYHCIFDCHDYFLHDKNNRKSALNRVYITKKFLCLIRLEIGFHKSLSPLFFTDLLSHIDHTTFENNTVFIGNIQLIIRLE